MLAWAVIERCGSQLRVTKGRVYGLDYSSVFALADGMGVNSPLLAETLPSIEQVIVEAYRAEGEAAGE